MQKLFIHAGFAKCGSTALQEAFDKAPNLTFPISGRNGVEHISLPLYLRGIDDWTGQFFDETWVDANHQAMMEEIRSSAQPVVLSSERLAALSPEEILALKDMFSDFETHIIFVKRSIEQYVSSTWRHAVFRHDFAESYEDFCERMKGVSLDGAQKKFTPHFPVHVFDMDKAGYPDALGDLIGAELELSQSNVGVPFELAQLLQKTHVLLGSRKFKEVYDQETKQLMLAVETGRIKRDIDALSVKLF